MSRTVAPAVLSAAKHAEHLDNVRLGILYMVAAVALFAMQNAVGKRLAESYPIPMLVFFRSFIALLPCYLLVLRAGGPKVLRTRRLGGQFGRALLWGGSNVASFFAYHLLPLADAVSLTFAAPLFLTALSWPILKERVGRSRWIAVSVGFIGVLVMAHPSGAGSGAGIMWALASAACSAAAVITVRDLCRTDTTASIVFYTALFMSLLALPLLPFYWVTPTIEGWLLLGALGLLGSVSQFWMAQSLYYAPASAVSPFQYTAVIWGAAIGFAVWGDLPTPAMILGAAIVTGSGLYLLRTETVRRPAVAVPAGGTR